MANLTSVRDRPIPKVTTLIERLVERENMIRAYRRVVRNKGAPGVDKMTVDELKPYLHAHWAEIKEVLLKGTYRPQPVKQVSIPKPKGGERLLGIPSVIDRLIQQALHQVLNPIFDPTFSEYSYGFREGRSAHQAVLQARAYQAEGRRWVVDIDLARFFDEVNHDILISKIRVPRESIQRFKSKLKVLYRKGRGRQMGRLIHQDLSPVIRGWINYFNLAEVKGFAEELDGWIRRRLRLTLWRQWKRSWTRRKKLITAGLPEERAVRSSFNGRGPWWNSGASHMNRAFPKRYFDRLGLVSTLDELRKVRRH